MRNRILTLILTFAVTGYFTAAPYAAAHDIRIAQIDDAFSPAIQQEVKAPEKKQIKEKKTHKIWTKEAKAKKKTPEYDIATDKKRDFTDAKKYAENHYKEKTQQIKEEKKSKTFWGKQKAKAAAKKKVKEQAKKEAKNQPENAAKTTVKDKNTEVKKEASASPEKNAANTKKSQDKNAAPSESTVEVKLQTGEGQQVVTGSVSANKIISVDDCVRLALENNPSIVSQMMSRDIYKNKIAQAWANYFPQINAGVSYSKNDMLMTNFKFPMQKYTLWNTPQVGFNQLIYDFGKTATTAKISKKTFEAAEDTLQGNVNDIIYQVKSAYYNLLYSMQQVAVYEDTVANYEIHLKQAKAYYEIGSKAKIDVTTAAYNLDNAKLNLIQARNAVEMAYAQLNNAMGLPEYADYEIKEKLTSKKYDIIFDDAIKVAYDQRPQLLAAQKKMEASHLLIKSTKVAFLPNLTGFGNYTNGGKNPGSDYGYQVGAQLTYQNLNLLLLKQQVDEAKLTYLKDKADYETQRQSVYLEVKQAYIQYKNAQESVPVALSSMKEAKEQYDLASGRYKVGMGDAVELKDAENTYRNAQLSYYNTLTQYNITAANLEKVVGAPIIPAENNL